MEPIKFIRDFGSEALVRLVQILNGLAVAIGAIVMGLHEMFPSAVSDLTATLSPMQKLAALAAWGGLVHFFLRQAKKA